MPPPILSRDYVHSWVRQLHGSTVRVDRDPLNSRGDTRTTSLHLHPNHITCSPKAARALCLDGSPHAPFWGDQTSISPGHSSSTAQQTSTQRRCSEGLRWSSPAESTFLSMECLSLASSRTHPTRAKRSIPTDLLSRCTGSPSSVGRECSSTTSAPRFG